MGRGGALLLRAADRCIPVAHDVGGVALLIDAKNDRAARWYESYGALRMDDAPLFARPAARHGRRRGQARKLARLSRKAEVDEHLGDARHADADELDGADFIRQFHGRKSPARPADRSPLTSRTE